MLIQQVIQLVFVYSKLSPDLYYITSLVINLIGQKVYNFYMECLFYYSIWGVVALLWSNNYPKHVGGARTTKPFMCMTN